MQLNNKVLISAAGSGKTTFIVNHALSQKKNKVLILTYTTDNLKQIKKKLIKKAGTIPSNITVKSWFSFLLTEGTRPYQNILYDKKRIKSIHFTQGKSTRYIKKSNIEKYYFKDGQYIYPDKISDFVCRCNKKAGNIVIDRLESMFDYIYIDEVQDLAGYDFDILDLLLSSKLNLVLVGDNRQATYFTNYSPKYKKFKGKNILDLFKDWEEKKKCSIDYRTECYRCNQIICDFADSLYPQMENTISENHKKTRHDGLFTITKKDIDKYIKKYNPQLLRYDRRTKLPGTNIMNFGESKGLTFDRVLIVPNGKIKKFLKTGDYKHIEKSKAKFYVAITRAKYSVAFIYDGQVNVNNISRYSFE